jgi:hypothetical protein
VLDTLGGDVIKVQRAHNNSVTVNSAHIIESEVFVYNLGTMFYIDEVLYANILNDDAPSTTVLPTAEDNAMEILSTEFQVVVKKTDGPARKDREEMTSTSPFPTINAEDVEVVPNEYIEQSGHDEDFLLQDDEIVTPKVLPVYGPK